MMDSYLVLFVKNSEPANKYGSKEIPSVQCWGSFGSPYELKPLIHPPGWHSHALLSSQMTCVTLKGGVRGAYTYLYAFQDASSSMKRRVTHN
jgi:hypothetical protein